MARDDSRRPTKRQKTPVTPVGGKGAGAGGSSVPRVSLKASAPKPKSKPAKIKAPKPAKPAKPAKQKAPKPAKPKAPKATSRKAVAGAQLSPGKVVTKVKAAAKSPRSVPSTPRPAGSSRAVTAARGLMGRAAAATTPRERRERHQRGQTLKLVAGIAAGLVGLLLVAAIALFAMRDSSFFSIDSVEVAPTEHVTEGDIKNLLKVPEGSTLLNLDTASIEAALKKDPWIASVSFERAFPHTLRIAITEQQVDALVVMSSGSIGWYLGNAGTWIQPTSIDAGEGQSVEDAALERALAEGCLLVTDVPATVSPVAGSVATDEPLLAVQAFRDGFSDDFNAQVVSFSAPSEDSVSCTLGSGVEVLLGSPADIAAKQGFIERIVEKNPGTLLFINVRIPSDKGVSYRVVNSDSVQGGEGVAYSDGTQGGLLADGTDGAPLIEQPQTDEGAEGGEGGEGEQDGETLDQQGEGTDGQDGSQE